MNKISQLVADFDKVYAETAAQIYRLNAEEDILRSKNDDIRTELYTKRNDARNFVINSILGNKRSRFRSIELDRYGDGPLQIVFTWIRCDGRYHTEKFDFNKLTEEKVEELFRKASEEKRKDTEYQIGYLTNRLIELKQQLGEEIDAMVP